MYINVYTVCVFMCVHCYKCFHVCIFFYCLIDFLILQKQFALSCTKLLAKDDLSYSQYTFLFRELNFQLETVNIYKTCSIYCNILKKKSMLQGPWYIKKDDSSKHTFQTRNFEFVPLYLLSTSRLQFIVVNMYFLFMDFGTDLTTSFDDI